MKKLKRRLKGKKTYQNTHGTIYRVKSKPNYKAARKRILKMQQSVKAQPAS